MMADAREVPAAALAGALTGGRAATLAGPERRGVGGVVLVGHKCVVVLVVLEVLGGTAIVVDGVGSVVDVVGDAT
jgi:hypothetical protein